MDYSNCVVCVVVMMLSLKLGACSPVHVDNEEGENVSFWQNYGVPWGSFHVQILDQNKQLQLSLDQYTGSAAFESQQKYGSGWFNMKIKIPQKDSTGIITTFYLVSDVAEGHDEIDFEFLGGTGYGHQTRPYLLSTNIYTNGQGSREQQFHLWFDPSSDFHNYTLLWNSHQIVFFVDTIPIRVFKNTTQQGGKYPTRAMNIIGSIWNGTWASGGAPVNWNDAPFEANYRGFSITACQTQNNNDPHCNNPSTYWWNAHNYWTLAPYQLQQLNQVRTKYLQYDYCSKLHAAPECQYNIFGFN